MAKGRSSRILKITLDHQRSVMHQTSAHHLVHMVPKAYGIKVIEM